jgi:hypothetical protein
MDYPAPACFPEYMRQGVNDWIQHGHYPGGYLTALFEGRVFDAVCNADPQNFAAFAACAKWIAQDAPRGCYGSPEKCAAWSAHGGLRGEG